MAEKFGKWIGGALGWAISGPIGGLVGFSLGLLWDNATLRGDYDFSTGKRATDDGPRTAEHTSEGDFAVSLLVLAAAVMKADDKVLRSELTYVKSFLVQQFGEQKSADLLLVLRDLLEKSIPLGPVCRQINNHMVHAQRLQLVHFLIGIANADGRIDPKEWQVVNTIAHYLRINQKDLDSLRAMYQKDDERYYRILEISPEASDEEVKRAYRKMAMKYHPDRLGEVGEEVKNAAKDKFHQVQAAYDNIRKRRKL